MLLVYLVDEDITLKSISVGQTNIKGMSRMTVVSTGDEQILTQIEKTIRETCRSR